MNVSELASLTRSLALDDTIEPYLWENTEFISALNRSIRQLYKVTGVKIDQETAAITQIKILSNLGIYDLDSRVLRIKEGRLLTNTTYGPLAITTEENLNHTVSTWRDSTGTPTTICPNAASGRITIYPKFDDTGEVVGDSDISFTVTSNTITKVGETFTDHYTVGDEINISGTTLNNGYFTLATVGTTTMTTVGALATEALQSATLRKVCDTLQLTVVRLPLTEFTTADIALATDISDLRADYHEDLIDGIASILYLKPDSQTFDPKKAEQHRQLFAGALMQAKRDTILLHKPDRSSTIRSGTGIAY